MATKRVKLLGRGSYGCAVTNFPCKDTQENPDHSHLNIVSKLFFGDEGDALKSKNEEKRAMKTVQDIDPSQKFSVPMLGSCKKPKGVYPSPVQTFCNLSHVEKVHQLDFGFGGKTVLDLARDFRPYFRAFLELLENVHEMHAVHRLGHFDVKSNNVVYDKHERRFRLIDWATLGHKPPERFMQRHALSYPPEAVFVYANGANSLARAPPSPELVSRWLANYRASLDYAIPQTAFREEVFSYNRPRFEEFVRAPANTAVFNYANDALWDSAYLQRIDAFGLGITAFDLIRACRFPNEAVQNHANTMAAHLLCAVPSLTTYPLEQAIAYLQWILGPCLVNPSAPRPAAIADAFHAFASTPVDVHVASASHHKRPRDFDDSGSLSSAAHSMPSSLFKSSSKGGRRRRRRSTAHKRRRSRSKRKPAAFLYK